MLRVPRRFMYMGRWLQLAVARRERPTSLREMLRFLTAPPYRMRGRRHVTSLNRVDDWVVVRFRDLAAPLYWPASLSLDGLWMVAGEQFDADDWHQYEIPETRVRPEDIVVDCGAAEGLFALRVAPRCRRVYAVEPWQPFVRAMQHTFAGLANVQIDECLLSDRSGTARLGGSGITAAESNAGDEVPMRTLDELFADRERPTYLKADVEGAELSLLAGAADLIRLHAPRIAITTYHHPAHASQIGDLLRELQPRYRFRMKGWSEFGTPLMLHAWPAT